MSARPGGHGGGGTRPSGRPGGVGEDSLTDEFGVLLTDEFGAVLTIPDATFGGPVRPGGNQGGGMARPK